MSTVPEVTVTLTDTEFTIGELRDFIDQVTATDGMPANALVVIKTPNVTATTSGGGPVQFEVSASTAYRTKS